MIYYIDGHNFLFSYAHELVGSSEKELLECISRFQAKHNNPKLKIRFVFDAYNQKRGLHRRAYQGVEVIFSAEGQTADEYIQEVLLFPKRQMNITVVSNDKQLVKKCRQKGASTCSFEDFFENFSIKEKVIYEPKRVNGFSEQDFKRYLNHFSRDKKNK